MSVVLHCGVNLFMLEEFPNHLTISDILDESIWFKCTYTHTFLDAHAYGYPL